MAFLAALLTYLGAVTGIIVALRVSYHAVMSTPRVPAMPQQIMAVAAKPGEPKATPATKLARGSVPQRDSAINAGPRARTASVTPRQQNYRLDRQPQKRHWAYQFAPSFKSRYMGYVDAPSADNSLFQ